MKIADIRTIALSCKVDPPYASAAGAQSRRGGLLVEVETDSGITGIGEAGLGGGASATVIEKSVSDSADSESGVTRSVLQRESERPGRRVRRPGRPSARRSGARTRRCPA